MSFYTKGNVHQVLPLTPDLAAAFQSLPTGIDPHAPIVNSLRAKNRPGNRPGPKPRFTKQWKALKERCGVRADLRIHDLRRTVAEDTWQATHDLRQVQQILGHHSITTTAKYLAQTLSADELVETIRKVVAFRAARASTEDTKNEAQIRALIAQFGEKTFDA